MNGLLSTMGMTLAILSLAACAPAAPPTSVPPTRGVTATANPTAPATATTAPAIAPTATQVLISTPTVRALNLTPGKMTRLEINHTKNPNAVCNDGSTAIFYFERGRGASINKWVIFFKGGAACWDSRSCAGREQGLLSATAWTQRTLDGGGILSNRPEENPDFSDWNHVFVVYCSSDFWSGTRPDNNTEVKFYFRGHYIVDAVVDAVSDAGMIGTPTVREASQVIFAGSSAGGIGVRINLDRLAKTLSWADVRGVMDAEMVVPTNPAYIQGEEDRRGKAMLEMYKPILDESCQASSAARPWVCFENAYAVANKQIATPMLVRHDCMTRSNWSGRTSTRRIPNTVNTSMPPRPSIATSSKRCRARSEPPPTIISLWNCLNSIRIKLTG